MPPSFPGLSSRSSLRQPHVIPLGSVLDQASRKADALVTIGPWRVVAIPQHPAQVPPKPRNGQTCAAVRDRRGSQQQPFQEPGRERPVHDFAAFTGGVAALHVGDVALSPATPTLPQSLEAPRDSPPTQLVPREFRRQRLQPHPEADGLNFEPTGAAPLHKVRVRRSLPRFRALTQAPPLLASKRVDLQPRGLVNLSAVSWALLSQVFWLPLVAIDQHDRWVARQREVTPPGQPLAPSPIARAPSLLNDLLGAGRPVQQLAGHAHQVVGSRLSQAVRGATGGVGALLSSTGSSASSLLDRPFSASLETPSRVVSSGASQDLPGPSSLQSSHGLLGRAFTRAQLLGGRIGLSDLQEGPMAPLALAERGVQRTSSDPLAPLPSLWREPMRQALLLLPGAPRQLSPALSVIVPSGVVSRPVEVPLALQSDGSVDVLKPPSDPAVLREIEGWSRRQRLPSSGSVQPALVHLHPLPAEAGAPEAAPGPGPAPRVTTAASPVPTVSASGGSPSISQPLVRQTPAPMPKEAPIPLPILSETAAPAPGPAAGPSVSSSPQVVGTPQLSAP